MKTRRIRTIGTLAAFAVGASLLTGCSAVAGLNKAAGCLDLKKASTTLSNSSSQVMGSMQSDPAGGIQKLDQAATKFDAAVKKIRDADVKQHAQKMSDAYRTFTTDLKKAVAHPSGADRDVITKDASAISKAAGEVAKACS